MKNIGIAQHMIKLMVMMVPPIYGTARTVLTPKNRLTLLVSIILRLSEDFQGGLAQARG